MLALDTSFAAVLIFSRLLLAQQVEDWFEKALSLYWNGEYKQTIEILSTVPLGNLSQGEKLEYYKYRAFSYIALGDSEAAQQELESLLSTDPGYRLDASLVSPKVIEQFDLAKESLRESWFSQGKASYFDKDYKAAIDFMDRILRLDPGYELAEEYQRLSAEQIALTEKIASIEAQESPPEQDNPNEEPADRVYHLSSGITPPVLVTRIDPLYPEIDAQMRRQGTVILLIIIGTDGKVENARVVRSASERIDKAALDAVTRWRYEPALLNGEPVRFSKTVAIDFNLGRR